MSLREGERALVEMIAAELTEETRHALVQLALTRILGGRKLAPELLKRELRAALKEAAERAFHVHQDAVIDLVVSRILEGPPPGGPR